MNDIDASNQTLDPLADRIEVAEETDQSVLSVLAAVLEARKSADPQNSYVASLYAKGEDVILQKIGEEAIETILAVKSGDREQIIYETADLWFHCLVMLSQRGLSPDDILLELKRRLGLSGLGKQKLHK